MKRLLLLLLLVSAAVSAWPLRPLGDLVPSPTTPLPNAPTITTEPPGPNRKLSIFHPALFGVLAGMNTETQIQILDQLLRELHETWKRQMELKLFWEWQTSMGIIPVKKRALEDEISFEVEESADAPSVQKRARRHIKKYQWVKDCHRLVELSKHLVDTWSLKANPLAIFPESDDSFCLSVDYIVPGS